MSGYDSAVRDKPELAQIVTHPDDPECPGHDINRILIAKSIELGYCLCIHPFMQVINFHGMGCGWCGQLVPENAISPETKEIRTQAVKAVLGEGTGKCTQPEGDS